MELDFLKLVQAVQKMPWKLGALVLACLFSADKIQQTLTLCIEDETLSSTHFVKFVWQWGKGVSMDGIFISEVIDLINEYLEVEDVSEPSTAKAC